MKVLEKFKKALRSKGDYEESQNEVIQTELVQDEVAPVEVKQEMVTVDVRDIKEYLVKEYDRAKTLVKTIEEKDERIEVLEEIELKYGAAMATLQEYSDRLDKNKEQLAKKEERIRDLKEENKTLKSNINDYKIQLSRASLTKDELKRDVFNETKSKIAAVFMEHKGNLSKSKALELIRGVKASEVRSEDV